MSKRKSKEYSGTEYVIPIETLTGTNLPSNRDVLGRLQYRFMHYHENMAKAVRCVVKEVEALWHNHNIPTKQPSTSGLNLKKLHAKLRSIRKNSSHASAKQKEIESMFRDQLNELFDIAHCNALGTMENADERQFLISQRRMGKSERALESGKKRKVDETDVDPLQTSGSATSDFAGDESGNGDNDNDDNEDDNDYDGSDSFSHQEIHPSTSNTNDEPTKKNIMTSRLAVALDRVGLSDRDAMDVISAVLTSAGHNLDDFTLSLQSISRARAEYRESIDGGT